MQKLDFGALGHLCQVGLATEEHGQAASHYVHAQLIAMLRNRGIIMVRRNQFYFPGARAKWGHKSSSNTLTVTCEDLPWRHQTGAMDKKVRGPQVALLSNPNNLPGAVL